MKVIHPPDKGPTQEYTGYQGTCSQCGVVVEVTSVADITHIDGNKLYVTCPTPECRMEYQISVIEVKKLD